jgi:hypothetical protein
LNFNDFHTLSAAPRDTGRDMPPALKPNEVARRRALATSSVLGIYFPQGSEEKDRVEEIAEPIVEILRQNRRRGEDVTKIGTAVGAACNTMMAAGGSQRVQKSDVPKEYDPKNHFPYLPSPSSPKQMEKQLNRIRALSAELLKELQTSPLQLDILIFKENRVIVSDNSVVKNIDGKIVYSGPNFEEKWGAKDRFMKQLGRMAAVEFRAPHHRYDSVKELSAEVAWHLMTIHSTLEPASTENSPFREIAGRLYEIACPSESEIPDLKRACDIVVKKFKASAS